MAPDRANLYSQLEERLPVLIERGYRAQPFDANQARDGVVYRDGTSEAIDEIGDGALDIPIAIKGISILPDGTMGWPVGSPANYLYRGVIGVRVSQAVTPDSTVHIVHTASADAPAGTFRADNTNAIALANARFLGCGAQNDIVPLSINLA